MGLDPAQARRTRAAGGIADGVAGAGRAVRGLAVPGMGTAPREDGRRAAGPTRTVLEPPAGRGAGAVLLPVPDPGRPVLDHPAVSVGRPGPVGHRHRDQDPAVVADLAV